MTRNTLITESTMKPSNGDEWTQNGVKRSNYKSVVPDGGWGFVVTASLSIMFIGTVVPLCVFGLVYGSFLESIGDVTYGTTLANGIFNTVASFTGLPANRLLQVYSCRKVGVAGAILFFLGNFGVVFSSNLTEFILTFGVLQGLGFGLMMPASFTAFNTYFDQRKNVVMGLCQASIVAITIAYPIFTKVLMETYGWRGTVLILSGISLHCVLAMLTFQPVKRHMKLVPVTEVEMQNVTGTDKLIAEGKPLLASRVMEDMHYRSKGRNKRPSVISIGSMALSAENMCKTTNVDKNTQIGFFSSIAASLDLGLFKSAKYVNIAFGLSLSLTSDLAFLSLLPLILINNGFSADDVTIVMSMYFASDLVSRLILSFVSAICHVRNRYVFLLGSVLSACFRTTFVMNNSFWWISLNSVALGFLRCFIQTPLPLVIAEEYGNRFTTAFSLYMVVCGVVALIFGPLLGYVKQITGSDIMVMHLLTAAYLLCAVPWTIELLGKYATKPKVAPIAA